MVGKGTVQSFYRERALQSPHTEGALYTHAHHLVLSNKTTIEMGLLKAPLKKGFVHTYIHTYTHFGPFP